MKMYMRTTPAGESNHPVYTIMSEKGIIAETFAEWNSRVRAIPGRLDALLANKPEGVHQATYLEGLCVADWVYCNWAVELTPDVLVDTVWWPEPN
jgi:hypothetical protein